MTDNDFAFIHIRPGSSDKKETPVATLAVCLVPEGDASSPRYAVGFAAQHSKKDHWDAAMGRNVARGRAERSAKRVHVLADSNVGRRDILIRAVDRVIESVENGEIFATKKVARALHDTLTRLISAESKAHDEQHRAAE